MTQKPVLNYKKACLIQPTIAPINYIPKKKESTPKKTDSQKYNQSCERALIILSDRWAKYKEDYIELYGEDTYEKMYSCPNYWTMPEDDELVDESRFSDEDNNNNYYESYEEKYYSE